MKEEQLIIKIDDKEISARQGETILDLARREKIHIPTLCHDPRIKPFASCFLCVVEVRGMKGLQPSCSTPVSDGMEIVTDNTVIRNARRTALELLLSNHYADCLGPCKLTCPAGVDVQGYISLIEKGMFSEAVALIKETNPLPAICGRVCVRPCELVCRRNLLEEGKGVGIDYLKRFAADMDLAADEPYKPHPEPPTGKKVAIIGAGPAGLSAAWWLQLKGHECHILEAAPLPGGWLRYGIPEYRLPNDILDREVLSITSVGVRIFCNTRLGKDIGYREINEKYDAMILSPGSQLGTRLGVEGDEAEGVMPGIDFLREMELTGIRPDLENKKVIVVGGGNTAMDCSRTAIRCGAESVKVVYRRSEAEMPANHIEIEESRQEGVEYLLLTNPVKVVSDENGRVKHIVAVQMKLGEPDESGRRKPYAVPGSEFIIEANLVLAAIGQKTDLSFIDDINRNTTYGELRRNRWGDIETNPETLETGVKNIFAAGDAVTGPDTIIGAIAQSRIAALSCHQYLSGEPVRPHQGIFISRRDNFRPPVSADLPHRFTHKPRNEMPLLQGNDRVNFREVELGYSDITLVREEASRCLECGCIAFHDCDLQRYATEYGAVQKRFKGEYLALPPDDTHPLISFDHNKCILCGRCIRICHELAGADALGFIYRGFRTVVGPGPGLKLTDTFCSSCGLCISTCPTGAITENTPFKPGPVETESFVTTDFMGSEGASIRLHHRKGFFTAAEGSAGIVNQDASIGREGRFSYRLLNLPRLTKPLIKHKGAFKEVSFDEALKVIISKFKEANFRENAYFGGARLTNEELFLLNKLAAIDPNTGISGCFQFVGPFVPDIQLQYADISDVNLSVNELTKAENFYILGADLFSANQLTGFRIFNGIADEKRRMTFITLKGNVRMERKASCIIKPDSYYFFLKAVISKILQEGRQNDLFIRTRCSGFEKYRESVLECNYEVLRKKSGVAEEVISTFAVDYNNSLKSVIVFADTDIDLQTAAEIRNLALLTGKTGKEGSGVFCIRQSCNSQGVIDIGLAKPVASGAFDKIRNMIILGEDPVKLASDKTMIDGIIKNTRFLVVQDFFLTETAKRADVILPSTHIFESGGSFTATGRIINVTDKSFDGPVKKSGLEQLSDLIAGLGFKQEADSGIVREEMFIRMRTNDNPRFSFIIAGEPGYRHIYAHGCNTLTEHFESAVIPVE